MRSAFESACRGWARVGTDVAAIGPRVEPLIDELVAGTVRTDR